MNWNEKQTLRIAILDLYEGVTNQGMRGMRDIVHRFGENNNLTIELDEFDVRFPFLPPNPAPKYPPALQIHRLQITTSALQIRRPLNATVSLSD